MIQRNWDSIGFPDSFNIIQRSRLSLEDVRRPTGSTRLLQKQYTGTLISKRESIGRLNQKILWILIKEALYLVLVNI
jgi:hypothetical protein